MRARGPAEGLLGQRGVSWASHDTFLSKWLNGAGSRGSCEERGWSGHGAPPAPSPRGPCPGNTNCMDPVGRLPCHGFGLGVASEKAVAGHWREGGLGLSLHWRSQFFVQAATLLDALLVLPLPLSLPHPWAHPHPVGTLALGRCVILSVPGHRLANSLLIKLPQITQFKCVRVSARILMELPVLFQAPPSRYTHLGQVVPETAASVWTGTQPCG